MSAQALANGEFRLSNNLYRFNMSFGAMRQTPFGAKLETATIDELLTQIAPLIEPGRRFAEETFGLIEVNSKGRWTAASDTEFSLDLEALQPGEFSVIKEAFVNGLSAFFEVMPLWSSAEGAADTGVKAAAAIRAMAESVLGIVPRIQTAVTARLKAEIEPAIEATEQQIAASPLPTSGDTTPELPG